MTDVTFPQLDDAAAEGVLATWYVGDGEQVAEGQLLGEIQVNKVDAEVTAPQAGTVTLLVAEDDAVAQGAVIARIE